MAKILFHTMVDKFIGAELSHALGLITFGADLHPMAFTREYVTLKAKPNSPAMKSSKIR